MLLRLLTFPGPLNATIQIGDIVYYSPTTTIPTSGFNTVNNVGNIVTFGVVTNVFPNGNVAPPAPPNSIIVMYDDVSGVLPPAAGDYIMFSKNKEVNSSSLKGYYASVEFVNHRTDRVELFAVGSEISESSK